MKYIIMCGGTYPKWDHPKQLSIIMGEPIVARTIRLLRKHGVEDIAISSNDPAFEQFGVPVLHHNNPYVEYEKGIWADGLYPMDEPCCYVFGDVVFSSRAIKTIVDTPTDDIEFFASAPPFGRGYIKPWVEPFALKVVNHDHLRKAIKQTRELNENMVFSRRPLSWELWQVIKCTPFNKRVENYTIIRDYTCDVDVPADVEKFNMFLQQEARYGNDDTK